MDETTVRPELIERLGALAHELDASPQELQAAAREWAEIEAVLAAAEAEVSSGATLRDAEEVFAEMRARIEERVRNAGR